jgi:putative ABC transport system permease protein
MIKNYFKTAWRNLWKTKLFTAIMLLGLSLAMSVCLLIISIIKDQLSFDDFHDEARRIYRINTLVKGKDNALQRVATAPYPLGKMILTHCPFVEQAVRVNNDLTGRILTAKSSVPFKGMFTEPSFFRTFGFSLLSGNPAAALDGPGKVVISEEMAAWLYGHHEALGRTLTIQGLGDFSVTGVLRRPEGHSQLEFDLLVSLESMDYLEKNKRIPTTRDWTDCTSNYLYLLLEKGHTATELDHYLSGLSTPIGKYSFFEENIVGTGKIAIGNRAIPASVLWVFSLLGAIIIIAATFNYVNLSIASSLTRAKEIGVRKIMGAARVQVFLQFLIQTILISIISLLLASILWRFLTMGFREMFPQLDFRLQDSFGLYGLFFLFSVLIGIGAGIFPAIYLSALQPVNALKDGSAGRLFSRLRMRRILFVFQFTICFVAIVSVTIIYLQLDFLTKADYGFNNKNIINLDLQGTQQRELFNDISRLPGVEVAGALSSIPGTGQNLEVDVKKEAFGKSFKAGFVKVDPNFMTLFGIQLKAGESSLPAIAGAGNHSVVINETALRLLSSGPPAGILGRQLLLADSEKVTVTGVVKDFNFEPLMASIAPLILRMDTAGFNFISMKVDDGQENSIIAHLNALWAVQQPNIPIKFSFIKDDLQQAYRPYKVVLSVIGFIGVMAIVITCMGLFGMMVFTVRTRQREIGIRKILGASSTTIIALITRRYAWLLMIAASAGLPLGYLLGDLFLEEFAFRIGITLGMLLFAFAIVFFIAFSTIIIASGRVAVTNPARSLNS